MEPAERLRQLREQHQLVSRHLAWLENEIAQVEVSEISGYTPARSDVVDASPSPQPHISEREEPSLELNTGAAEQARRSRLGCILAAVVGAAILLFLIWGLPQFLY